jgi:hypothetical protein
VSFPFTTAVPTQLFEPVASILAARVYQLADNKVWSRWSLVRHQDLPYSSCTPSCYDLDHHGRNPVVQGTPWHAATVCSASWSPPMPLAFLERACPKHVTLPTFF